VTFAAVPYLIEGPGTGEVVGVDRGVVVSAALSTGEMLTCPRLSAERQQRLKRLQRTLARARRGSTRRAQVKSAIARLRAREADARKDWAEKLSTHLAWRFDVIRVEERHRCRTGAERSGQSRAEPADPRIRLGHLRSPLGAESARPGREGQPRVYQPALLGVRAYCG
jgi:hypothetical protein